jgi:hypothetical protein
MDGNIGSQRLIIIELDDHKKVGAKLIFIKQRILLNITL